LRGRTAKTTFLDGGSLRTGEDPSLMSNDRPIS
jgi:hypothetical protein